MERQVRIYVQNELFKNKEKPPITSRRFYPCSKDIRNHMYLSTIKLRFSEIDQENVDNKIKEWKKNYPNDKFLFRPYLEENVPRPEIEKVQPDNDLGDDIRINSPNPGQRLLFVHQTSWQSRLLNKYGNYMCLLDATYRTTRQNLSLFVK